MLLHIRSKREHVTGICDGHGQALTKGLLATQRFALGAIFACQLTLLYRFEYDLELWVCLKAFRKRSLMIYDRASTLLAHIDGYFVDS